MVRYINLPTIRMYMPASVRSSPSVLDSFKLGIIGTEEGLHPVMPVEESKSKAYFR